MTLFFYLFSLGLGTGISIAVVRAWLHDHQGGRWNTKAIAVVAIASVLFGLALGWGMDTYVAFVNASATQR